MEQPGVQDQRPAGGGRRPRLHLQPRRTQYAQVSGSQSGGSPSEIT